MAVVRFITKSAMLELNAALTKYNDVAIFGTLMKPISEKQIDENRIVPIFRNEDGKPGDSVTVKFEWPEVALFLDLLRVLKKGVSALVQFMEHLKQRGQNLSFYHMESILGFDIAKTKDGQVLGLVFYVIKDKQRYQILFRDDYNTFGFLLQLESMINSAFDYAQFKRMQYWNNGKTKTIGSNQSKEQMTGQTSAGNSAEVSTSDVTENIMEDIASDLLT